MMSAIGTGNIRAGIVTVSLGTSGTICAFSEEPVIDPKGEVAAFCDATDHWLPLTCTMNVAAATQQVRELFGWDLSTMEERVEAIPPGAGGILFSLTYRVNERRTSRKAEVLSRPDDRKHEARFHGPRSRGRRDGSDSPMGSPLSKTLTGCSRGNPSHRRREQARVLASGRGRCAWLPNRGFARSRERGVGCAIKPPGPTTKWKRETGQPGKAGRRSRRSREGRTSSQRRKRAFSTNFFFAQMDRWKKLKASGYL